MTSVVLDASALMAVLRLEPGAEVVRQHLAEAFISAVNYSEVLKKTIERGGASETVQAYARNLSLRIVPFGEEHAAASAGLYPQTKPLGLSFADRACLALGLLNRMTVLTAETKWASLALPIKIIVIRGQH